MTNEVFLGGYYSVLLSALPEAYSAQQKWFFKGSLLRQQKDQETRL